MQDTLRLKGHSIVTREREGVKDTHHLKGTRRCNEGGGGGGGGGGDTRDLPPVVTMVWGDIPGEGGN